MNGSIRVGKPYLAGPRVGILAVAATLALAATAFASGRLSPAARQELGQDGSVSYPATYAKPLGTGTGEAAALDAALENSGFGRALARRFHTGTDTSARALVARPHDWSVIDLPHSVAKELKDVKVYLLRYDYLGAGTRGWEYWRIGEVVAVKGIWLYSLRGDLVQLLRDCGSRFRQEDVPAWLPVVVFAASTSYGGTRNGYVSEGGHHARWDSMVRGQVPAFPAMRLVKVTADTAKTASLRQFTRPGDIEEVRIVVQVGVETDTMSVETERRDIGLCPGHVYWRHGQYFFSSAGTAAKDEDVPAMQVTPNEFVNKGSETKPTYYTVVREDRAPTGTARDTSHTSERCQGAS